MMSYLVEILVSVVANVAANYICKWLDRHEDDGDQHG